MSTKHELKDFADKLFNSMNIDETQKAIFQNVFEGTIDNMTNNDVKNVESQIKEFVKKKNEEKIPNVFD